MSFSPKAVGEVLSVSVRAACPMTGDPSPRSGPQQSGQGNKAHPRAGHDRTGHAKCGGGGTRREPPPRCTHTVVQSTGAYAPVLAEQAPPSASDVTIRVDGAYRVVEANGLPEHAVGRC